MGFLVICGWAALEGVVGWFGEHHPVIGWIIGIPAIGGVIGMILEGGSQL